MLATHANNKSNNKGKALSPAPGQPASIAAGKAQLEPNSLWQTLALRQPVIQAKLSISQPDDPYEREADHVADQVMRMAIPQAATAPGSPPAQEPGLRISSHTSQATQRKCDACEDEEEKVQRKEMSSAEVTSTAPSIVSEALKSGGQPLDENTQTYFESRFDENFDQVRVHTDAQAANAAHVVQAKAYATGSDIVFGAGQYAPATDDGKRLIAHELAHVVQQGGGGDLQSHGLSTGAATQVQRAVDPAYVVHGAEEGKTPAGAAPRVFFARNLASIPATEQPKIEAFKSGPGQTTDLTLLGLATEDELAVLPDLPTKRANAVDSALGTPLAKPAPNNTKHDGKRTVTPGTLANTQGRPNLRFNRAVEMLTPGQASMSPSTPIAAATTCNATIETAFQAAKTMSDGFVDNTRPEVQKRPLDAAVAADLDRFFGNHTDVTADLVDKNLDKIKGEVGSLAQAANHDCADPNLPGCVSAIAFNSGGSMTICSGYITHPPEDRARNLVHEAGHSTAGLGVTTAGGAPPRTSDFAYRHERLINQLGKINPDQALSNSDSYAMFLLTRRAAAAITPGLLPTADPAPTGFAKAGDAEQAQRAIALAQVWARLATQGLTDLHGALRGVGTGKPVPADLSDPARLDLILTEVKARFKPILSTAKIRSDDLLMIAGVLDRYEEIKRIVGRPIAMSPGAKTAFTAVAAVAPATTGSLKLTVDPAFLAAAGDQARARTIMDKLIEFLPPGRISAAMWPNYGAFAEFVRDLHQ